jgi:hypothetical protein
MSFGLIGVCPVRIKPYDPSRSFDCLSVVRHFATGIAIEFSEKPPADTFDVDTKL